MTVVMLAGAGDSTWIVANALKKEVSLRAIIVEEPVSSWARLRGRARRLGLLNAVGQVLFVFYAKLLAWVSKSRMKAISGEYGFNSQPPSDVEIINVPSANDPETAVLLRGMEAHVIVVNGTRILAKALLASVGGTFVNMHAGITPKYRGVHGGYWAFANGDAENAGVTVHLVDPGIDTGGVLYQARIHPTPEDNFCTYPLLQLGAGLPLLARAVRDVIAKNVRALDPQLTSRLYYHPTLWGYLWLRVTRHVR